MQATDSAIRAEMLRRMCEASGAQLLWLQDAIEATAWWQYGYRADLIRQHAYERGRWETFARLLEFERRFSAH